MTTEPGVYSAHERLVGPGRAHNALWRLVIGLVVITGISVALGSVMRSVLMAIDPIYWGIEFSGTMGQGNKPLSMLVLLCSFGFAAAGVFFAAWFVHKRPPLGVIGPIPETVRQFWRVARILIALSVVLLILPPYGFGEAMTRNLAPGLWMVLLPLSLVAVLIQSGTEELLFRGYIQQALAARFSSPFAWMVLPAALFSLGHFVPAESGENAMIIAAWAGIFGLLMADLTARAGTLGPAIAVHMFNNVTALLIVSVPDSLSGLSLYTTPFSLNDTENLRGWLAADFAMMFVSWLAARLAIRR